MIPASTYLCLAVAIVAEVIATSALKASDGFTKLAPSLITVAGYAVAFWLLSFAIRAMPAGIVYAIWSGAGIVLISAVGWVWFKQSLDAPALFGLGLIVLGVIVVNVFSKSVSH
ncbi:DMT family transporter [Labrys wisconsinensis]|uniref:Small multidrug resistance pump n=1 Tax=Labrys wisconsinensis TaxID=425677 RepID=A0ABU0J104_9HYPH|nr:SMR family transporter [Labrys wisconsinensis]MDQ0467113.1 small multidrug resistance pump [Labrys wisconsinensis]